MANAYARDIEHLTNYPSSATASTSAPVTDLTLLLQAHRFIRTDGDDTASYSSSIAAKHYASLFKDVAIVSLKHYKHPLPSRRVALRWRSAAEVIAGKGSTICGSVKCESVPEGEWEVPFAYTEEGVAKTTLVKLMLCAKCARKLRKARTPAQKQTQAVAGV